MPASATWVTHSTYSYKLRPWRPSPLWAQLSPTDCQTNPQSWVAHPILPTSNVASPNVSTISFKFLAWHPSSALHFPVYRPPAHFFLSLLHCPPPTNMATDFQPMPNNNSIYSMCWLEGGMDIGQLYMGIILGMQILISFYLFCIYIISTPKSFNSNPHLFVQHPIQDLGIPAVHVWDCPHPSLWHTSHKVLVPLLSARSWISDHMPIFPNPWTAQRCPHPLQCLATELRAFLCTTNSAMTASTLFVLLSTRSFI